MTKKELKQLAQKALDKSNSAARWIAIDNNGQVYAYMFRPILRDIRDTEWDISDYSHEFWGIGYTAPPKDFTKELYELSKILSDDVQ